MLTHRALASLLHRFMRYLFESQQKRLIAHGHTLVWLKSDVGKNIPTLHSVASCMILLTVYVYLGLGHLPRLLSFSRRFQPIGQRRFRKKFPEIFINV